MNDELPTVEETEQYAIDVALRQQQAQLSALRQQQPWNLAEWAVGLLHELDHAEEEIKARAKAHLAFLLQEAKGRRAGLLWKYGAAIRKQVVQDTSVKKKSVTYATGRAGFRTVPAHERLVLDDEAKAIKFAEQYCPEAIRHSIDMKMLKSTAITQGTPDGCHYETTAARETFFIGPLTVTQPDLPAAKPTERLSASEFLGIKP